MLVLALRASVAGMVSSDEGMGRGQEFVAKLATGGKRTLVYPKGIRDAVRQRFQDPAAGSYDDQYEDEGTAYHVTMEDILAAKWRAPPKSCKLCGSA
ncbi:hypothetical protein BaRGS_00024552 [Batillaria attramentaria]|uniref:Uncharacterized protein n=1 Tax=Batillaria attramentaria TaxID=370345 RepID=A0ABD0KAT9_9CAEN